MNEISITTKCSFALCVLLCSDIFLLLVSLGVINTPTDSQLLAAKVALILSVMYMMYLLLSINMPLSMMKRE